ncbi:hypothetical protein IVB69_07400 [Flavobacterium sp. J49]|uniref:hypothetical protein n=1 Tax=Flavobacterium sp. J49 TaxID=2718534 RepID=UPI00159432AE|nr:hypothetical protein [Flavobacterium sp. J49]MBF6641301.1 hypothetical protein [Flavobacterium sp. J49]NIC02548.1 hypothetical protein [Flavobacterium sp. J49]
MYHFIQKFHSGWAYLALLLLVFAVVNSFMGMSSKREFTGKDRKIALFGLIATHIQLVVGLILYFVSDKGFVKIGELGMGAIMKNDGLRQIVIEHPFTNIVAIVLITIGWSKHKKKETNTGKFKSIGIFYIIGLILLLAMIPWSTWLNK